MSSTSKSPKPKGKGRACIFCEEGNVSEDTFGKLISRGGITAHYFCMLFSSGLSQNGKSEKQGILGFLQTDIMKEIKRGARLKCSYCKKNGATIGCVIRNCKKMFHLGCGRKNDTLHQYFGTFSSFCAAHRQQQDVPSDDDPNIVCSICMNTVTAKPTNNTIRAPCCNKYWYHRECVQRYATSAGLYFFKCPLCNNKEEFQGEMLTMGIYIPDQDASWEKEPHAFRELLERYGHCDAPVCKCAEGRKYDKEGSKWEIILCDFCGSHGAHVACNHLEKLGKHDICSGCKQVDERTREEEYLLHSPPNKKKSLELLQLELASSPESTKGSSPYPGPSNSMRKSGLPKSPTQNIKQRSGAKKGKRAACTESRHSLPKAKKSRNSSKASATVTSASAKSRTLDVLSSSMSSQSSDDSSDDDLLLSENSTKLQKMTLENAWDVMRRRKLESGRKMAEKKEKKKNSKADKLTEANGKKDRVKRTETISAKTINLEDSDTDVIYDDRKLNVARERVKKDFSNLSGQKKEMVNRRLSLALTNTEKEMHSGVEVGKRESRLSLCSGKSTLSGGSNKNKQKKQKRESLESDKGQTTLTNWLKPKVVEENSKNENEVFLSLSEQTLRRTPRKNKQPVVMEWKGKQLLIRSPRVVLRRSRSGNAMKMKPKCLEIDMTDSKGSLDWKNDIDLLSNLDSDVRVTRKMIGIDEIEAKTFSKKEKHNIGKVLTTKNVTTKETPETKASYQNEKKLALVQDTREATNVEMNEEAKTGILNSDHKDSTVAKCDSDNKTEFEIQHSIDSPAKNLRVRIGKDTTKMKSANQIGSVIDSRQTDDDALVCSPGKSSMKLKHQNSQSCDSSDSPAKSLRSRHQKEKRKQISLGDTDNCLENSVGIENELTPLIQSGDSFNFTVVKEKSSTEKEKTPFCIDSPIIQVKNSSEFGSIIVINETFGGKEIENGHSIKTNPENLERLKPIVLPDSPAKNLRKRSHPTNVAKEIGTQKADSDSDSSINYDHLERLKKYRPKVEFLKITNTDPLSGSACIDGQAGENNKKALKDKRTFTVKSVTKHFSHRTPYPKLYWHLEGTRQVLSDTDNNSTDSFDFGCENTCPNSQAATNKVGSSAQDTVKPAQGRGKDYSNILGEKINELYDKLPTSVSDLHSANKLGNVVDSLLEDDQVSQRNILNGIKNNPGVKVRSSPRSVNKVSATTRKNIHMADNISEAECNSSRIDPVLSKTSFSDKNDESKTSELLEDSHESQVIVINGLQNSPAMKLRSSPRSVNKVSSTSHKNIHVSDRASMAEYYGACLKSEPKGELNDEIILGNDGYSDNDSDIIEIAVLGNVM